MAVTFVEQDEYYDVSTAWPSSLPIVGAPAGTARGDRLFLVVLSYNSTSTLDNWNLGSDWTLLAHENGTAGVSLRSTIHIYTARHQDGAPLPATISPRTSGGTLITTGTWYRAHLYSVTPSHPVNGADVARGGTTSDQPDDDRGGLSVSAGDYAIQLTAVFEPGTRTLDAINNPAALTYTLRASVSAVSARGGVAKIIDATRSSGTATGDIYGLHDLGGSGGSITVRSAIVVLDADPDPDLPPIYAGGIFVDGAVHVA